MFLLVFVVLIAYTTAVEEKSVLKPYTISVEAKSVFHPEEAAFSIPGTTQDIFFPISTLEEPFRKNNPMTKVSLRSNGCSCLELICGCCLDLNIQQINFERTGCMNLTFNPQQFSMTLNMLWNNESILENTLSGRNPEPICVPLPVPYIPISMDTCFKVFDISLDLEARRMHACLDLEARIQRAPVLVLHFDCLELGTDASVALVKPIMVESNDYEDFVVQNVTYNNDTNLKQVLIMS